MYVLISGVVTNHKFNNNNNNSSQYPSKSNCFPCTIYFHWNIFCVWSFCHFHKFLWKETASKANTTVLRSADDYSEHKRVKANLNKFFLKMATWRQIYWLNFHSQWLHFTNKYGRIPSKFIIISNIPALEQWIICLDENRGCYALPVLPSNCIFL